MPFGPVNAPAFYSCMINNFKIEWDALFIEVMKSSADNDKRLDGNLVYVKENGDIYVALGSRENPPLLIFLVLNKPVEYYPFQLQYVCAVDPTLAYMITMHYIDQLQKYYLCLIYIIALKIHWWYNIISVTPNNIIISK